MRKKKSIEAQVLALYRDEFGDWDRADILISCNLSSDMRIRYAKALGRICRVGDADAIKAKFRRIDTRFARLADTRRLKP